MPHATPFRRLLALSCVIGIASSLVGCFGIGQADIGGTVEGLGSGASLTLQNNDSDNLTVSGNGSFTFAERLGGGETYSVTVLAQPAGHTCTVSNGTGTVDPDGGDVSNVTVSCSFTSSVGGTLSGLSPGNSVTLATNGRELPLASNGPFAFKGILPAGTAFDVTVAQQPAQQTCSVANASGTVEAGVMASVDVSCQ